MRALVTDGAGFIGSNLTDKLIELGHEVIVWDNLSTGKLENINKKAEFVRQSVCFPCEKIDCDVIFHMAALARIQPSKRKQTPNNHLARQTKKRLHPCV